MQINKSSLKQPNELATGSWPEVIKRYLMARKKMHVLSYRDISDRLLSQHIDQSPQNLSAKFNQGKLGASLFVSSLIAMGEKDIDLEELEKIFYKVQKNKSKDL